jgi:hypothetical protein
MFMLRSFPMFMTIPWRSLIRMLRSRTGDTGMKFLPIALVAVLFLAVPLGLIRAHADGPIEVTSPPGDDSPNQVLEIPPACAQDGGEAVCEDAGSDSAADPSAAAPAADPSGASAAAQAANAAGDVGTAQDYQDQVDSGLVYPPGVPAPYGSAEAYPRMPTLAAAPMPIAPFLGATPFVPSVIPATGPIVFGRAWMPAPRPFTPMTMRPMGAPGMPRGFRLR